METRPSISFRPSISLETRPSISFVPLSPWKFVASIPLTEAQRARLLAKPMALLAQGGYHGVTPFFDPGRATRPDAEFIP